MVNTMANRRIRKKLQPNQNLKRVQKKNIYIYTLIYPNSFPASVAILRKHGIEALQTIGATVSHNVPLSSELSVALETSEMLHVPGASFRFRAFVSQNNLKRKTNENLHTKKLASGF